jgi:hypothetical protein
MAEYRRAKLLTGWHDGRAPVFTFARGHVLPEAGKQDGNPAR